MKSFLCRWMLLAGFALPASAFAGDTNVLDGVSTNVGGPFILGDSTPLNFLLVTNGASLTNTVGIVGNALAANANLAVVTGTNSVWHHRSDFFLGATGSWNQVVIVDGGRMKVERQAFLGYLGSSNQVEISDGGLFETTLATIGLSNSATLNAAQFRDAGTIWANAGSLTVGDAGPANLLHVYAGAALRSGDLSIGNRSSDNQVVVNDGSVLNSGSLWIGNAAGADGNVLHVEGPGGIWTNASRVTVGDGGSGNQLIVAAGGVFRPSAPGASIGFTVGSAAGSHENEVAILGDGAALLGSWALRVGYQGWGNRLIATDGARVQTASADIGQTCGAHHNGVLLTGAGTVWSNGLLQVGFCSTNNYLIVSNGAQLFAGLVRSSVQGGRSNVIAVAGAGAFLRAAGDLVIGNSGVGDFLEVTDGGRVGGRFDRLGLSGMGNRARLSGAGATWTNLGLTVGEASSDNALVVEQGARLDSGGAVLGLGAKAMGNTATLVGAAGAASLWQVTSNLQVGGLGRSNRLTLAGAAGLFARNVYVGAGNVLAPSSPALSDWNEVLMSGTGATVTVASNLFVGASGRFNHLEIRDGARVDDAMGAIGYGAFSRSNAVRVTGAGSSWNNVESLVVGGGGARNGLTISSGGGVTSGMGIIGFGGELVGEGSSCLVRVGNNGVLVTDPGSSWVTDGLLVVGSNSIGNSLVVSNGGTVRATGLLVGTTNAMAPGSQCGLFPVTNANRVLVHGGGLLVTNAAADAVLEVRQGSLTMSSGVITTDRLIATNEGNRALLLNGGTLTLREGMIQGAGSAGPDSVRVGADLIPAVLRLAGGTLRALPGFSLGPFGTLSGEGVLESPSHQISGTIAPGGSGIGRLTLSGGTFSLSGDLSALAIDIAGTAAGFEHDQLVTDSAVLEGYLQVRLVNGFVPRSDDAFVIMTSTVDRDGGFWNLSADRRVLTADRLGSFLVRFEPANVVLTDFRSTDLDGDGINDDWAREHFGHSPLTAAEKAADVDGDGMGAGDEFVSGTDPWDAGSVFRVSILGPLDRGAIEFVSVPHRRHRVWFSADLVNWQPEPDVVFQFPVPTLCRWIDDGKGTGGVGGASRFYRVTVE